MALQGPHQSAQKSTSTGISFALTCFAKFFAAAETGFPVKSGLWHRPHFAAEAFFPAGTRFTASQAGHTICGVSVLMLIRTIKGCRPFPWPLPDGHQSRG